MALQEQALPTRRRIGVAADHEHYKWWALSVTSLGMLLATINSGTLIIALPDLERSLHTTLLQLVWVILAYMIASTVLVLTAGRLSDLFGRKRAYVLGFAFFTLASRLPGPRRARDARERGRARRHDDPAGPLRLLAERPVARDRRDRLRHVQQPEHRRDDGHGAAAPARDRGRRADDAAEHRRRDLDRVRARDHHRRGAQGRPVPDLLGRGERPVRRPARAVHREH